MPLDCLLAAGDSEVDAGKKIRDLRNERIDTLRGLVEATTAARLANADRTSRDEVWQARVMLLNAELDACETVEKRLSAYTSIVELLKENETELDAMRPVGEASRKEILKAKAMRLKAEIDLEELKGHGDKTTRVPELQK